jgi:hypothetical protein
MKQQKLTKTKTKINKKNPWIDHVKTVCQSSNLNFKTALQKGRKLYHKQKKENAKLVDNKSLIHKNVVNKQL